MYPDGPDAETQAIQLNGVDPDTGHYLLPPLSDEHLRAAALRSVQGDRREVAEARHKASATSGRLLGTREGVDPEKLEEAGWAAVFPAVTPGTPAARRQEAILAALAPLLGLRQAEATRKDPRRFRIVKGADGVRTIDGVPEDKWSFCWRLGIAPGLADPDVFPYYVLLVGSPSEIPFDFQHHLDVQYAVGRLDFDRPEEYARYAANVVAVEGAGTRADAAPGRLTVFGVAHPTDRPTTCAHDQLVEPLTGRLADLAPGWHPSVHTGAASTRARLRAACGGTETPDLIVTVSHGAGGGKDRSRTRQGALVTADWAGPGFPIPDSALFGPDAIDDDADLRGLIAFLFACYGAGTPATDLYEPEKGPPVEPFTSATAKAMLGHTRGALALIGHIGRAVDCSYRWRSATEKGFKPTLGHFEDLLKMLASRKRVGHAMEAFDQRAATLAVELAPELQRLQYGQARLPAGFEYRWLSHQDARSYAVLGDPAVRLAPGIRATLRSDRQEPPPAVELGPGPTTQADEVPAPTPGAERWVRTWRGSGGPSPERGTLLVATRIAADGSVDTWITPEATPEEIARHAKLLAAARPSGEPS